jgi:hypothetical protein
VYRYAWVVALVLTVISLFTLGTPETPVVGVEPASFDGGRAMLDVTTLAEEFPGRVAGSDADARAAIWLVKSLERLDLETHIDSFTATINGDEVPLQNVWAVAPGTTRGTIVVVANRDSPPRSTQGADANASGTATLLELARVFTMLGHEHTLLFLSTDGDAYGALGARDFVERHETDDVIAVIALRRTAGREADGLALDGWGPAGRTAPPWLWLVSAPAARRAANMEAHLPGIGTQVLRLAVPTSSGSQAPFVAAGLAAISLSAAGDQVDPVEDTLDAVSGEVLVDVGRTAEKMIVAVDAATDERPGSGGTTFVRRHRTLPGASLTLLLVGLLVPLAAVTVDLFAQARRRRVRLGPAWVRACLHVAPWFVVVAIVYLSNTLGLLPRSPGATIPPESGLVDDPRYLRVAVLVVVLLLAYAYATAVERRLARRVRVDPQATVFVAHASLLLIALLVFFVNPYSLLLVVPAAALWPLARGGAWTRSILPVYLGLSMIVAALVFFALRLDLGLDVWWYFFLLLENGSIPASATLLGAVFVAIAGMLAHTLHGWTPPRAAAASAPAGGADDASPPADVGSSEDALADVGASSTGLRSLAAQSTGGAAAQSTGDASHNQGAPETRPSPGSGAPSSGGPSAGPGEDAGARPPQTRDTP